MIKLYISVIVFVSIVFVNSCSKSVSGPVDEFPNYINIQVMGEPVAGNTKIYLASPNQLKAADNDSLFFAGTTDSQGNLTLECQDYLTVLNITAVNNSKGVFIDSIDFSIDREIELYLEDLGTFVVSKDISQEVYYSIYSTPWFGFIGSNSQYDSINIPLGSYNITFSSDSTFASTFYSTSIDIQSDSMVVVDLVNIEKIDDDDSDDITDIAGLSFSLLTSHVGTYPPVGDAEIEYTNSSVSIINGLCFYNGEFTIANDELLSHIISEQTQDNNVEFYIADFLLLNAPERYNIRNLNDSADMARLYSGYQYLFESLGSNETNVVIEPLLIGKLALQIVTGVEQSVLALNTTGELVESDILTFFSTLINLRNQHAPNTRLGFFVSDDLRINETSSGILGLVDEHLDSLAAFWQDFMVNAELLDEIDFLTLGVYDTSLTHFSLFNSMSNWQLERYLILGELLNQKSSKDIYLLELPARKSITDEIAYIVPLGTAGYDRSLSKFFFTNISMFHQKGFRGIIYSGEPVDAIDLIFEID